MVTEFQFLNRNPDLEDVPETFRRPWTPRRSPCRSHLQFQLCRQLLSSKMAKIIDPILPILSILGYWAIILGSLGGPGSSFPNSGCRSRGSLACLFCGLVKLTGPESARSGQVNAAAGIIVYCIPFYSILFYSILFYYIGFGSNAPFCRKRRFRCFEELPGASRSTGRPGAGKGLWVSSQFS